MILTDVIHLEEIFLQRLGVVKDNLSALRTSVSDREEALVVGANRAEIKTNKS